MDTWSLLFNTGALVASITSLLVSSVIATRQSRLAKSANHIPLLANFLGQFRSKEIWQDERNLWTKLTGIAFPENGDFSSLPDDVREGAYRVCQYYQMMAYLVFYGALDERIAFLYHHYSLAKSWTILKPYIYGERRSRGDPYSFFNAMEELTTLFGSRDSTQEFLDLLKEYKTERQRRR